MTNKINMYRGDTKKFKVIVRDQSGVLYPITGVKAYFTVKTTDNAVASIAKRNSLAGGDATEIEMSDPSVGEMMIYLLPTDTENLNPQNYIYDVQIIINEETYTVIKHTLRLIGDVTR